MTSSIVGRLTSFSFIVTVTVHLLFVSICEMAEYDRFAMADKRKGGPIHACGSLLADVLSDTCEGIFNRENPKRADDNYSENTIPDSDYHFIYERYPDAMAAYPFRSKRSVSSMLRSPAKRKIVDECCLKPCSRDVLKSYCAYS